MLEHFHAGRQIEGGGPFLRQFLRCDDSIIRGHLALERVQLRYVEHCLRQVDAEHPRTGARHRLGQNAPAAADVEHLLIGQTQRAFDVL